jgi:hypothetical protein
MTASDPPKDHAFIRPAAPPLIAGLIGAGIGYIVLITEIKVTLAQKADRELVSRLELIIAAKAPLTDIIELKGSVRSINERLRILEEWRENVQRNRFTDRDGDSMRRELRSLIDELDRRQNVQADELRRRLILLEQHTFGRNLDGLPPTTPR